MTGNVSKRKSIQSGDMNALARKVQLIIETLPNEFDKKADQSEVSVLSSEVEKLKTSFEGLSPVSVIDMTDLNTDDTNIIMNDKRIVDIKPDESLIPEYRIIAFGIENQHIQYAFMISEAAYYENNAHSYGYAQKLKIIKTGEEYFRVIYNDDIENPAIYDLKCNNTKEYIPTQEYHPATKKYVDDEISAYGIKDAGELRCNGAGGANLNDVMEDTIADIQKNGIYKLVVIYVDSGSLISENCFLTVCIFDSNPDSGDSIVQEVIMNSARWKRSFNSGSWSAWTYDPKVNGSNILAKNNSSVYTPTQNYHPATKKYVDDIKIPVIDLGAKMIDTEFTLTEEQANQIFADIPPIVSLIVSAPVELMSENLAYHTNLYRYYKGVNNADFSNVILHENGSKSWVNLTINNRTSAVLKQTDENKILIDTTLTKQNSAAEAKATGEAINLVNEKIGTKLDNIEGSPHIADPVDQSRIFFQKPLIPLYRGTGT